MIEPDVIGFAMSAFYGGRAEARIVRSPVPVITVDCTSMYPTVNALLGTWILDTAEEICTEIVTEEVDRLLSRRDLVELLRIPANWREQIGVTLVEVAPQGGIFPVRAAYDPASASFGIGVNPYHYDGTVWYALPDALASVILTGKRAFRLIRAIRFVGHGRQALSPVVLRGVAPIDPLVDDPFVTMIEQRHRVRADPTLTRDEIKRRERFFKTISSATAYGIQARFDPKDYAEPAKIVIYGPDAAPFGGATQTPEDAGPYCFPPIAASITSAARLKLALLEHAVRAAGGSYAFCDTDSMAIVATRDGRDIDCPAANGARTIRSLSTETVRVILARFNTLSPYDPELGLPVWKIEHESDTREVWCLAISAKRYALYELTEDGSPRLQRLREGDDDAATEDDKSLVAWSEHGLGLYLDPLANEHGEPRRDAEGNVVWIREAWEWIIARAHGLDPALPTWATQPGLTRFTVSSPNIAKWFDGQDRNRPRDERMRPAAFGILAHPDPMLSTASGDAKPATIYEPDSARWATLPFRDRATGLPLTVTTASPGANADAFTDAIMRGCRIRTLGDVLLTYISRPEHKSLGPDGQPVTRDTRGLLQRRPVHSAPALTDFIGKESNHISERLAGARDPSDAVQHYGRRAPTWHALEAPVLRLIGAPRVACEAGLDIRTVQRAIREGSRIIPHPNNHTALRNLAVAYARMQLHALGRPVPADAGCALYALLV
jgi:hypothetical protein